MTVYLLHVVEEKNAKVLVLLQVRRNFQRAKLSNSFDRKFEPVENWRRRQRRTCRPELTRVMIEHLMPAIAGKKIPWNQFLSPFCHADVTLLENVSASSVLGSSWIVSCENKHRPSRNLSENFLTNLVARAAEFRSCEGYFPPEATFDPAL